MRVPKFLKPLNELRSKSTTVKLPWSSKTIIAQKVPCATKRHILTISHIDKIDTLYINNGLYCVKKQIITKCIETVFFYLGTNYWIHFKCVLGLTFKRIRQSYLCCHHSVGLPGGPAIQSESGVVQHHLINCNNIGLSSLVRRKSPTLPHDVKTMAWQSSYIFIRFVISFYFILLY